MYNLNLFFSYHKVKRIFTRKNTLEEITELEKKCKEFNFNISKVITNVSFYKNKVKVQTRAVDILLEYEEKEKTIKVKYYNVNGLCLFLLEDIILNPYFIVKLLLYLDSNKNKNSSIFDLKDIEHVVFITRSLNIYGVDTIVYPYASNIEGVLFNYLMNKTIRELNKAESKRINIFDKLKEDTCEYYMCNKLEMKMEEIDLVSVLKRIIHRIKFYLIMDIYNLKFGKVYVFNTWGDSYNGLGFDNIIYKIDPDENNRMNIPDESLEISIVKRYDCRVLNVYINPYGDKSLSLRLLDIEFILSAMEVLLKSMYGKEKSLDRASYSICVSLFYITDTSDYADRFDRVFSSNTYKREFLNRLVKLTDKYNIRLNNEIEMKMEEIDCD